MSYSINTLFAQLGLPADDGAIAQFVKEHSPLPAATALEDAPWWSSAQSSFLHEALEEDADWAPVVEQLDSMLH